MNGIHDLGGMQGFGPIAREENEPVFHADWERRIFALLNLTIAAGQYHVDEIRHSIERMAPAEYLTTPYYVHCLHAEWLNSIAFRLCDRPPTFAAKSQIPSSPCSPFCRNHM